MKKIDVLLRLSMQGIHVTAYSPLGTPDSASMMKRAADTPSLLQEEAVKKVADRLSKAPAQVWCPPMVCCPYVAALSSCDYHLKDRNRLHLSLMIFMHRSQYSLFCSNILIRTHKLCWS